MSILLALAMFYQSFDARFGTADLLERTRLKYTCLLILAASPSVKAREEAVQDWADYITRRGRPGDVFAVFPQVPKEVKPGIRELSVGIGDGRYVWSDGKTSGISRWSVEVMLEYHLSPSEWPDEKR